MRIHLRGVTAGVAVVADAYGSDGGAHAWRVQAPAAGGSHEAPTWSDTHERLYAAATAATWAARENRVEFFAMGKLLERAIDEAHKLPESEQEAVGAWLLAEIESERRWDELFSRPPSEALKRLAEEALDEHRRGLTIPLDPDKL